MEGASDMLRFGDAFRRSVKLLVSAGALAGAATLVMFGRVSAEPTRTFQSQTQSAAVAPAFEYEIVSVKPSNADSRRGTMNTPDGYRATNIEPLLFIDVAYGILNKDQLAGVPGWVSTEKYDIDAKMESSVADAFGKLSPDDRKAARQHMMQMLLADRFKLVVHHETRVLSIYTLTIGKNGLKLKEAKPGDTYPNGIKVPSGNPVTNTMQMRASQAGVSMTAQAVAMPQLIQFFEQEVGRIVVDKSGLTGAYDFTLQYMPDAMQTTPGAASGGASPLPAAELGNPSLFTAIQEQLGLKLEAGKLPIDVVVIDHIERPSGN
jgi:uncharacterized protein (TIGR03435 family)